MPYKIVKQDDKFCVAKADDGLPVQGGCHTDRKDAVDHLQALYSNEAMAAVVESFNENNPNVEQTIALASEDESPWSGFIAFEGVSTGDNRSFAAGSITWNDLPIPLLWQKTSSDGHSGSWVIGRVDTIEKQEGGKVFATGVLLSTPEAVEYKTLLEAGAAGGCSIDGDTAAYSVEETETKGQSKITFSSIRIRALTCVAIPAFASAQISLLPNKSTVQLGDEETEEFCDDVTATPEGEALRKRRKKNNMTWSKAEEGSLTAAALVTPPSHWFDVQDLPGPTPLTVLDNGQVFGHIALWGTCHIGMPKCTAPPKGGTYAYFHTGALSTLEGEEISVGHLTFNTGHAGIYDNAFNAASHYDHTGAVAADVVAGEDKYGIWVAGAMRPHLTEEEVRIFKSAPISGDWRKIGARLELVAALSVNTPGFPVPRTRSKVLVAGGQEEAFITIAAQDDFETFGREAYKADLLERVNLTLEDINLPPVICSCSLRDEAILSDEEIIILSAEEDLEAKFDSLAVYVDGKLEEFYNQCHDTSGHFCEGEDGPGRVRDNNKKSEELLGKKAPQYMKNILSRKRGAAVQKGADLLPATSPQYMKDMMKRKMEDSVVNPKTPAKRSSAKVEAKAETTTPVPDVKKEPAPAKANKETKSESSGNHPASDYAYVPEGDKSSGWKLRLTDKPGGEPSAKIVGAAVAALGKGFRGHKVEIPAADRPKVVAKVRAAWLKANPDKTRADLPDVLKTKKG